MASPSPYIMQRPGFSPLMDYTTLVFKGDVVQAAALAYKLEPLRKVREKWFVHPWVKRGILPIAYLKVWCDHLGMVGGAARPPLLPVTPAELEEMRRDLERVGLV